MLKEGKNGKKKTPQTPLWKPKGEKKKPKKERKLQCSRGREPEHCVFSSL
jgi:hypothetical protein